MPVRSREAAEQAGVTYRQLNHWLTIGYVTATAPSPRADWAAFTPTEVLHISVLGRCGRAGWSPQHVAPTLGTLTIGTGPGWIVVWRDPDAPVETAFTSIWVAADALVDAVVDYPGPLVLTPTSVADTISRATRRTA